MKSCCIGVVVPFLVPAFPSPAATQRPQLKPMDTCSKTPPDSVIASCGFGYPLAFPTGWWDFSPSDGTRTREWERFRHLELGRFGSIGRAVPAETDRGPRSRLARKLITGRDHSHSSRHRNGDFITGYAAHNIG
jgi:hypothetical protein